MFPCCRRYICNDLWTELFWETWAKAKSTNAWVGLRCGGGPDEWWGHVWTGTGHDVLDRQYAFPPLEG
jgi:hypothetical protein